MAQESFNFFQLPYPIQIDIVAYLSLRDTRCFAATSRDSRLLTRNQTVWKKKLWHHAKIVNLCLEKKRHHSRDTNIFVKDPLLIDMKKLYEALHPEGCPEKEGEEVERENFMAKIHPSQVMSFSSVGLQDLFNFLNTFFHRPPPKIFYDPFSKGVDAPSFILFGPPETQNARKLALSMIASKNNIFETIGLVKGRPGGLGGGVTVSFGNRFLNFLPVRKARPRLLVEDSVTGAVSFHPDVAEVVKDVNGLIYYLDSKCSCNTSESSKTTKKRSFKKNTPRIVQFHNLWQHSQSDLESKVKRTDHPILNDFYELDAMFAAIPDHLPPVLVILVHNGPIGKDCTAVQGEQLDCDDYIHCPSDLLHKIQHIRNPWMITRVEVESLKGIHQGINWLVERIRIMKGK